MSQAGTEAGKKKKPLADRGMDGEQVDISQQEVEKLIQSMLNVGAQHSICNGINVQTLMRIHNLKIFLNKMNQTKIRKAKIRTFDLVNATKKVMVYHV